MSERLEISIVSGREMGERRVGERKHVDRCFSLAIFIEPFYYVTRGYFVRANENRSSVLPLLPAVRFAISFDTPKVIIYTYVRIFMYTRGMA